MKQNKLFFVLVVCSLLMFSGCEESEELNLLTYPENQASASITDAEGNSEVTLKATYNGEGELELDGEASRTYMFRFNASPEDILISYELISTNIPEELAQISKTEDKLPKGSTDALVDVSFLADDFSFAKTNYEEETYELGVKASVVGYKIPAEPIEAKVVVQKEAYSSSCSILGDELSSAIIEMPYSDGAFLVEGGINYAFTIQLDKPAVNDVKVKLSTKGSSEEALGKVTMDNEVVIPKGQKSSSVITWSLDEDFLLQSEIEEYTFSIALGVEDEYASVDKNKGTEELVVRKVFRNIGNLDQIKVDWQELTNKSDWTIELLFSSWYSPKVLIDGKGGKNASSIYTTSQQFPFMIDFSKDETIRGLAIDYYDNYGEASCTKRMIISTSSDKKEWVSLGELKTPESHNHYIQIYSPVTARYIKVELLDKYNRYIELTEVYVYK